MHPYLQLMRFDKPIGIWLLFLPAGWAVALAAQSPFQLVVLLLLMLAGATVTRAAGCILNDLADRKLDIAVARTRSRPLAAGTVTIPQAIILLMFLLLLALIIAVILPPQVLVLAFLALPMIALYPWMKRFTWWPQFFLGLTFNLSALMGWAATGTPLSLPAFMLYAAAVFWTLAYDTIYAVQDMKDDKKAGIRSSALAVGKRIKPFSALCFALMFALLAYAGILLNLSLIYYLGLFCAGLHAMGQINHLPCTPKLAGTIFRSNQWLGLLILMGILAERLLAS